MNPVEKEAGFRFGEDSLLSFITANFQYSEIMHEMAGIVALRLTIESDSTVSEIKILNPKERRLGFGVEEECLRVLNLTKNSWTPNVMRGVAVKTTIMIPIEI